MQEYFQDLSGNNLYTVFIAAKRKRFEPEYIETVQERLVEAGASNASVVDMLPDLYRLAAFSEDFEEFRSRFETVVAGALFRESARGENIDRE